MGATKDIKFTVGCPEGFQAYRFDCMIRTSTHILESPPLVLRSPRTRGGELKKANTPKNFRRLRRPKIIFLEEKARTQGKTIGISKNLQKDS